MILFSIFVYALFLAVLYKVTPERGYVSIFGLRDLFFIVAAAELPFVVAVALNPDILHERVRMKIVNFEAVFLKFLMLKALFMAAFSITAFRRGRKKAASVRRQPRTVRSYLTPMGLDLKLTVGLLVVLLASFYILLQEVGGFATLIGNWSNKSEVLRGTAFVRTLTLVTGMMSIGFFINYIGKKGRVTISDRLFLAILIMIALITLVSVGERKNPVLVILFAVALWHYRVRTVSFFQLRYALLVLLLLIFAALFPELRKSGGTDLLFSQPAQVFAASMSNWGQLFARMSDIETSLFIYSYFDNSATYWYGASYPDLLTGMIPSQFMPDKPPVDEGVYIYALSFNVHVVPPVPFRDLFPVGWPVSRVTGPFVHFGVVGVLVGGLLTGIVMRRIHDYAFSGPSPAPIFVYIWAMFTGFGLTNAFIFNLLIIVALLVPIELVCKVASRRRPRLVPRGMPAPSN